MQTYYIINPRRGAEISFTKFSAGASNAQVEPIMSSTYLHLVMHIIMAHELTTVAKWAVNSHNNLHQGKTSLALGGHDF
jgi:hypothetical protein